LLVVLPDGELEDIGTTFSVSADSGHTTRVTVQEGSVVLRLHGEPPLALGAGDSWSPLPAPAAAPIVPATPPPVLVLRDPRPAPSATSATPVPSLATPVPSLATPVPDPAADFREAMSAFNSGDNPHAAARFAAFLARHPRDPRAEDAAYLRILALQRGGSAPAAQQAARDYLTRYPRGFRHAEVAALAR
jgi:ferric-dicitrate binding protein FerR (iron transport regulator)